VGFWIGQPQREVDLQPRFAEADLILQEAIRNRAFPGCAYGVLHSGHDPFVAATGAFTYEPGSPFVSASTMYDIASLTKVVATTATAMLLYQRDQLELDFPLGELLPGFVVGRDPAEHARRVTIRHLLAHTSGLTGYAPMFQTASGPADILRACLSLPIEAEPGTRVAYSDPGFILLGKALETLIREDLATYAHREIFQPLGMESTGFCPPASIRSSIPPTEEDELFRQRRIQGEVQDEHAYLMRGVAGHAGLFSNVPDLLRFARTILNPSDFSRFTPETVEVFAERQPPASSSRTLGWDTPSEESSSGKYFSALSVGHLGYSGCSFWIDREARVAIVLLTNRTWPHRESQAIRQIRPAFHDAVRRAL
jgi:CubicO group peptidase (beta-lactamase class C family)